MPERIRFAIGFTYHCGIQRSARAMYLSFPGSFSTQVICEEKDVPLLSPACGSPRLLYSPWQSSKTQTSDWFGK